MKYCLHSILYDRVVCNIASHNKVKYTLRYAQTCTNCTAHNVQLHVIFVVHRTRSSSSRRHNRTAALGSAGALIQFTSNLIYVHYNVQPDNN